MFGWLRKLQRSEQIKLVTQNLIAAEHLREEAAKLTKNGIGDNLKLVEALETEGWAANRLLQSLERAEILSAEISSHQLEVNTNLRRIYAELVNDKRVGERVFGIPAGSIVSFDDFFVPDQGWRAFIDGFGIKR
jgi:hypothetical protein